MWKKIIFINVIAIAIMLNACYTNKCVIYYAHCEIGHTPWKGSEFQSDGGPADPEKSALTEAIDHDDNIHGGIRTASVSREYREKIVCK